MNLLTVFVGFLVISTIMGVISPEEKISKRGITEIKEAIKKKASKEYIDYLRGRYRK